MDGMFQKTEAGYVVPESKLAEVGGGDAREGRKMLRLWLAEQNAPPVMGPFKQPTGVRMATEVDEAAVLELVMMEMREGPGAVAPPNPARIINYIMSGTRRRGSFLAVTTAPDGTIAATMLLVPMQWWWSEQWFLSDIWAFVHPDHRQGGHAQKLLQWASWMADEMSRQTGYRVYVQTNVMSVKHTKRKMRLWGRFSNFCGGYFLYPRPPEV